MLMAFCACIIANGQLREKDVGGISQNKVDLAQTKRNSDMVTRNVKPRASTTVYIQNETISGSKTYSANVIKVGSSVTSSKEQGDVVFNGGTVILLGDQVEIHPKTTALYGTKFEIRVN